MRYVLNDNESNKLLYNHLTSYLTNPSEWLNNPFKEFRSNNHFVRIFVDL